MTRLARCTCKSRIQASALYNARTNTSPNEHANEVIASLPRSIEVFTEGGNLNIVADSNWFAKLLVEEAPQVHIFHPQVWSIHDNSRLTIDLPCSADTNCNNTRDVREFCIVERCCCNFDRALPYKVLPFLSTST